MPWKDPLAKADILFPDRSLHIREIKIIKCIRCQKNKGVDSQKKDKFADISLKHILILILARVKMGCRRSYSYMTVS